MGRVSVLGCGWFGLPMAASLVKRGHEVTGSVRTGSKLSKLESCGIEPVIINLDEELDFIEQKHFLDCETLIISIPPTTGIAKSHFEQVKEFLLQVNDNSIKIIYISSTSVYVDNNNLVTEKNIEIPVKGNGAILRQTENYIRENFSNSVVLRFGGLIGPDRNPAKYFAGRKNIPGGKNPVNLVHLDDCMQICNILIEEKFIPGIYNVCSPEHPTRAEFYTHSAEVLQLEKPEFQNTFTPHKIVSPELLLKTFNYTFKFNSPMQMI